MELLRRLKADPEPLRPTLRLQVLSPEEILPSPMHMVNPNGLAGALVGIPLSMRKSSPSILSLERPMEAGEYLFQGLPTDITAKVRRAEKKDSYPTRDPRPGVCGYDGLEGETLPSVAAARWVVTLELSRRIPGSIGEAISFGMELGDRLALLTRGVVLDEVCRRYYLPGEWRIPDRASQTDAREHVSLRLVDDDGGGIWMHTHGLVKFGLAELEVRQLAPEHADAATWLLSDLAQRSADGAVLREGQTVGAREVPLMLRLGGPKTSSHFAGRVLELVDVDRWGRPAEAGATQGMEAYRLAQGGDLHGEVCSAV